MAFIAFWIVLGLVGVAVSWTGYRERLEAEKTIRLAIEKGVLTDAALIGQLKRPVGLPWAQRLTVFGVIVFFVSAGIAAFALLLSTQEPESLTPLMAVAAFVAVSGVGLLVCGWWLRRVKSDV